VIQTSIFSEVDNVKFNALFVLLSYILIGDSEEEPLMMTSSVRIHSHI